MAEIKLVIRRHAQKHVQNSVTKYRYNDTNGRHKRSYCNHTLQSHVLSDALCSQAISVVCSQFVAHPYSQLMLNSVLYDQLGGWEDSGFLTKLILGLLLTVSGPLLALCYFLLPNSRISKLLRRPIFKFINHTGSFCLFLMLLIFSSIQDQFYDVLQFQIFGKYVLSNLYLCHFVVLCYRLNCRIPGPAIGISLNKNSNYCDIPRSSKHTGTCKWLGRVFCNRSMLQANFFEVKSMFLRESFPENQVRFAAYKLARISS